MMLDFFFPPPAEEKQRRKPVSMSLASSVDARKAGVATLGAPSAEPPSAPAAAVAEADPFAVGQRDHRLVVREEVYPGYSLLLNKCARPCRCVHLPGSARLGSD